MMQEIIVGDCVEVMRGMDAESIDAIVTDPPYGIGFMNQGWDRPTGEGYWAGSGKRPHHSEALDFQAFSTAWALEALRILKPGAHLLAFGGPRTFHRMTCAIDAAGWEIRDCLAWLFGSGFPKSLNLGDGRGTALKPGWEPCIVARKPLIGTVASNVERYGTGALNIDACRIGNEERVNGAGQLGAHGIYGAMERNESSTIASGRWPTNVALDEEAASMLDAQSGERRSAGTYPAREISGEVGVTSFPVNMQGNLYDDMGGASRFFYTAKASRSEREAWGRMTLTSARRSDGRKTEHDVPNLRTSERVNDHPTVKPLALMEWLIKLATPPGGLVLDPFAGSGSTIVAAKRLNIRAIGIEKDERSAEIARQRIGAQWEVRLL